MGQVSTLYTSHFSLFLPMWDATFSNSYLFPNNLPLKYEFLPLAPPQSEIFFHLLPLNQKLLEYLGLTKLLINALQFRGPSFHGVWASHEISEHTCMPITSVGLRWDMNLP